MHCKLLDLKVALHEIFRNGVIPIHTSSFEHLVHVNVSTDECTIKIIVCGIGKMVYGQSNSVPINSSNVHKNSAWLNVKGIEREDFC